MYASKTILIACTIFFIFIAFFTTIVGIKTINAMNANYALQIKALYTADDDNDGINNMYDSSFRVNNSKRIK